MKFTLVLHSDDGQHYGDSVSDLPGCLSAGDSIENALESAKEAIKLHLEGLMEAVQELPVIAPISRHQQNPDYAGGRWSMLILPPLKAM